MKLNNLVKESTLPVIRIDIGAMLRARCLRHHPRGRIDAEEEKKKNGRKEGK